MRVFDTVMPRGVALLRLVMVVGPVIAFAVLWTIFFVRIWQARNGAAPNLSSTATYVIGVIGGVLGTYFATTFGIQRRDDAIDARQFRAGVTLLGYRPGTSNVGTVIATLAVWVYALVGAWSLLTILVHEVQSPKPVKTLATAFASLVFAMFAAALAPGQTRG